VAKGCGEIARYAEFTAAVGQIAGVSGAIRRDRPVVPPPGAGSEKMPQREGRADSDTMAENARVVALPSAEGYRQPL